MSFQEANASPLLVISRFCSDDKSIEWLSGWVLVSGASFGQRTIVTAYLIDILLLLLDIYISLDVRWRHVIYFSFSAISL